MKTNSSTIFCNAKRLTSGRPLPHSVKLINRWSSGETRKRRRIRPTMIDRSIDKSRRIRVFFFQYSD